MAYEQVKYGSIVVLHKDGPSPRPHSLKLGPTTIGSSANSDIRVKTILSRTVQCIISTRDNGLVTIENKSKAHPVFLNGAILKTLEVLIDGDKFEVAGRAFQYINDKQKNRNDLIKILEKSSTRRQTTAATVMSSSSKIPVSSNAATAASRIPVKKKRSLSLSESKENKKTSVTRLCATASSTKRTTSLVSSGHGLRKVLFDETSKDQCGPSPFLALNMRTTRRSQSLTDRSLSTQSELTHSLCKSSAKLDESVNETKSPVRSPLPESENKPKTPKITTLSVPSTRKSMRKISEECGIENESIDLIDFDISNVERSPLPRNEEAQIACDAEVSIPRNSLKSPQSDARVVRSKSCSPMKSPIKQTSITTVETNDRSRELSQSLSEVEHFVSPQKVDEDNLQEEDEIPSPNYEVISPSTNGFGSDTLVEPLKSSDLSTQPVTDDDSTFFTPADNTLDNSNNESDSFKLQLETSNESPDGQSPVRSPTKSRNSTPKSSVLLAVIKTPSNNSRKSSLSSSGDVNEAAEETLVALNNSKDSKLVSVAESTKDLSALEPSTPKWKDEKNSTAVFTRSGRKCSLPLKLREFQSISSTPKSAVKKRIVENVIMETSSYETTVPASEASFASTVDSTSSTVDTSNFEITDDVLNQAPIGGASRAKSLTAVRAKTQLRNKSLPPLLQTVDGEESVSSLPSELDLSSQQSVISISDVSQDDSVQSDANNSVIFKPVSTPPANNPPASSYKTPSPVQISESLIGSNTKQVRFSDTYVPKPRTPLTRQKIRSLTPASVKTKRLNKSMPLTTVGLSSVAENLEDSVLQKTEENFTPQTPCGDSPRKSNRMSSRKSPTTPKKSSIVHISDAEASILSENGDAENESQMKEIEPEPAQTPGGVSTRKSNRMSARKTPKEATLIDISDADSTLFENESCVSQSGENEEEKQEMADKVLQTPSNGRKSARMSSRKLPTTPKEASVVQISDAEDIEEDKQEMADSVLQTPSDGRKSVRMSSRKQPTTPKEPSIVQISDAEDSVITENGDAETEESDVKNQSQKREIESEESTQTPGGGFTRKSNRMSARKTPKEISLINISDAGSTFFENESCVSQSGETEEKQEMADKVLQTPSNARKSARMSSRKLPTTPKEASVVQLSDAEDTEEDKQEMADSVLQTPSDGRKSVRMSSRRPPTTPVTTVHATDAEASSFSEEGNAENGSQSKIAPPVEKPQTPSEGSIRKSNRVSARKTPKEISLIDISDADSSSLFGDESCVAQPGEETEEVKQEMAVSVLQTPSDGRKSIRMSARKLPTTPKEASVVQISDARDTEEDKQEMADSVLQTPSDGRKSVRMSSRKPPTTPKEASVVQISDAEDSVITENGDAEAEESDVKNQSQKREMESKETPQTPGGGFTRKSNRMSARKTPKEISLINISDAGSTFGNESCVSQPGESEEEKLEMADKVFQTPSDGRKSVRLSSRKPSTTPVTVVHVTNTEANGFSEVEQPQTPSGGSFRKSNRVSARKTPKEISLIDISDADDSSLFGDESCVAQPGEETEEEKQEMAGEVHQTSSDGRKSIRMSSRKQPTTPKEASIVYVSNEEASISSENKNAETEVNEPKKKVVDPEETPQTPGGGSTRKSNRMSARKTSKETSLIDSSDADGSTLFGDESCVAQPGETEEEKQEIADKALETPSEGKKSVRISSRKQPTTPKEASIVHVLNSEASIISGSEDAEIEGNASQKKEIEPEETLQTPGGGSTRKSNRMSARKTPKKISLINIADAGSTSIGHESCVSQSRETEEKMQETSDEVTQTPSAISEGRSVRMSSRTILKETSVVHLSDAEVSCASVEGDEESNGENGVEKTPQASVSSRKSAGVSSRKSSKAAPRTSVKQMSIVNTSSGVEEASSFSEELDEKSDDDKIKQTPQTSFSSRKTASMSSRKSSLKSSIVRMSDLGDTIAADHNYSLAKGESNDHEESLIKQQTPQASSSPRKSVQRSSRKTPITSDVAAAPKADDSVINSMEKTPLSNVRHFRAKSHTPGIVRVHTARKRSLPLLQKTLKKAAALIASTPVSSVKSLGKAETPVAAKSSEKGQTPARKSQNKRLSAGIVSEAVEEGSPVTAFVQQTVSQETLAARRSSRMSKKKSVSAERTPIQLPRGTKRARDTPATIQSRKRRKLDQSSEDENASMNSFCEESSTYETPKSERLHKPQTSPMNDLTEVSGLKRLMKTPRYQNPPLNDLSDVKGVKKLLATPRIAKSPANDLTKITGVKRLMKTPKPVKSPLNDLSEVKGVKKLMRTPRVHKSPKNDLQQVTGVKKMFASPITLPASPLNDLTNVDGVKELMQLQKMPRNDLTDVEGVEQLFTEPQKKSDEVFDSLFDKKQMKTYHRKSLPSHLLQPLKDNKNQRASSADQSSCPSRVYQWVEASQQHFEKIKKSKEVNVENSKSVETTAGTENKRATPLRTSRGKLPSRYLEADYVFPKVVTHSLLESATTANINKLADDEITAVTDNKVEGRAIGKEKNSNEKKSDQTSKNNRTKEAVDENAVTKDYLKVPQRVTRKRSRSSSEPRQAVLKPKKTEDPEKIKSDSETASQKVTRKRPVRDATSAPVEKVLKRVTKQNAVQSGNSEIEEMPPPRSTRKAAKKETLPEDASQKSVKNKRTLKKDVADFENEEMVPPRSTRKAAKKETLPEDAPQKSVKNKRIVKKDVTDSVNEEMLPPRSTRKAVKKETLKVANVKTEVAPKSSVKGKKMAKKSVADSENEELAAPRSTRKAAKKDISDVANDEPEDTAHRSVKNKRIAKQNVVSSENEEMPPPRSTRKVVKKENLPEEAPQKSVKSKRIAKNITDSENEDMVAPRSTRKAAKKETFPEDVPQKSVKNKRIAKNVSDSENEGTTRSTRKAAKKDALESAIVKTAVAPQSSVKRMAKRNVADSDNAEMAAPRSTRKAAKKETLEVANDKPEDAPQRSVKNKKISQKNVADSENEKIVAPRSTRKAGRKGAVEDVNNEYEDAPQRSTRKRKDIDNAADPVPLKRRKQEVEDPKKKAVKFTEAKSTGVDQQKVASSKTKKESEKAPQPSQKTRATRKQTVEQKDSSTKTAMNIKVQTAPQPRPTREKLPASTRSTRSTRK